MNFLNLRCKGAQKRHPEFECGKLLGGPSIDSINKHDFLASPLIDVRHCPECGWIEITIEDVGKPVRMRILDKEAIVDFVKPERLFGFVLTEREPSKQ